MREKTKVILAWFGVIFPILTLVAVVGIEALVVLSFVGTFVVFVYSVTYLITRR